MVVYLIYIKAELNRSHIACVMLDPGRL